MRAPLWSSRVIAAVAAVCALVLPAALLAQVSAQDETDWITKFPRTPILVSA